MRNRLKILLVVPPERLDFYHYLSGMDNAEFYILWTVAKESSDSAKRPAFIKGQYYWSDYLTPSSMLNKIRPDRIVLFEIIDLRQIALIAAAHKKKITSFYLEHGAAGDKESAKARWNENTFLKNKLPYLIRRLVKNLKDIILSKLFYFSNVTAVGSFRSLVSYISLPFKMLVYPSGKALHRTMFPERMPDFAITFNQINFEELEVYVKLPRERAIFTGVPQYDSFYKGDSTEGDHIVYIEHPYLEENLLGWNADHHRYVAQTLNEFAVKSRRKLYIKLHPRSNRQIWDQYQLDKNYIEIIQHGNFQDVYLKAAMILGFSSSLLNGFLCAKKNIVLLGWHPQPQIFGFDYSQTGLCHKSMDPKDLLVTYEYWLNHNLCYESAAYTSFIEMCNSPFDGKATERVIKAIIENEVA